MVVPKSTAASRMKTKGKLLRCVNCKGPHLGQPAGYLVGTREIREAVVEDGVEELSDSGSSTAHLSCKGLPAKARTSWAPGRAPSLCSVQSVDDHWLHPIH